MTSTISPIVTGKPGRRTIITPNYRRLFTTRSTRYVVVCWHNVTVITDHGQGQTTESGREYATIVRGSNDIAKVRRPVDLPRLGRITDTSFVSAHGSFIVDLVIGEVVK